jgi:cell division protease FtsH
LERPSSSRWPATEQPPPTYSEFIEAVDAGDVERVKIHVEDNSDSDEIAREIDDEIRRIVEEAHQTARQVLEDHREQLEMVSDILLRRETIEREQFIELLDGKTEQEVFGAEQPHLSVPPPAPPEAPERKPERTPKPLPRPGLAGGAAEMRADPPPEKS